MKNAATKALTKVVSDVLSDAAFLFVEPAEEGGAAPGSMPESIWLSFEGPFRGVLRLTAPKAFGSMLAMNMLGADEDTEDIESKADDALKELVNIVGGNLVTELAGSEPVFEMSVPEFANDALSPSLEDKLNLWDASVSVTSDGHVLLWQLSLSGENK